MGISAETIEKIKAKRFYRLKGVLFSIEPIKGNVFRVVLSKGQGLNRKLYFFTAASASIVNAIRALPMRKTTIRVYFSISCKTFGASFYTSLYLQRFDVCETNEKKIKEGTKQAELFDDSQYSKSLLIKANK